VENITLGDVINLVDQVQADDKKILLTQRRPISKIINMPISLFDRNSASSLSVRCTICFIGEATKCLAYFLVYPA